MTRLSELRDMSEAELAKKENELREDLFRLRFKLSTGELEDTSDMKKTRRTIARIRTIMNERASGDSNASA